MWTPNFVLTKANLVKDRNHDGPRYLVDGNQMIVTFLILAVPYIQNNRNSVPIMSIQCMCSEITRSLNNGLGYERYLVVVQIAVSRYYILLRVVPSVFRLLLFCIINTCRAQSPGPCLCRVLLMLCSWYIPRSLGATKGNPEWVQFPQ